MPIDTIECNQGVVINVSGVFDRDASTALEEVIRQECQKGKNLVINLYDVNYISSVSLGTLIRLHSDLAGKDIKIAISEISEECRKIFDMAELDKIIPVYEDNEMAFESLIKNKSDTLK